ncbi:MAG: GTPase Era [Deltaproteobacteria bacterium]|nr:GTPase Era [Deltaproteobacteria bacterium]
MMADASRPFGDAERLVAERLGALGKTLVLALNKVDAISNKTDILPRIQALKAAAAFEEVFPISATGGDGMGELVDALARRLPEGPPYYPEDELSTADLRFIAAEMIREQIYLQTQKEIPYATTVVIDEFREPDDPKEIVRIEASVIVEREGQKGIVIGKGAARLKSIGSKARASIEALLDRRVYLGLHVKVRQNWTSDAKILESLGYR